MSDNEYTSEFMKPSAEEQEEQDDFFTYVEAKIQGPILSRKQVEKLKQKRNITKIFRNFVPDSVEEYEHLQVAMIEKNEGLETKMVTLGITQSKTPIPHSHSDLHDRLDAIMDHHSRSDMKVLETTTINKSRSEIVYENKHKEIMALLDVKGLNKFSSR